jgi:hypothetical protein
LCFGKRTSEYSPFCLPAAFASLRGLTLWDEVRGKAEGHFASPLMTKTPKRPRELNQGAKRTVDIATSEMSDREPTPPTSGENVANALDRWDEEGGAPAVPWPLPYETGDLLDAERRVLECLGAALVSEWNDLPTDVQRRLFEHAASGKSNDAALLKARIARFLHNHKDDWAAR